MAVKLRLRRMGANKKPFFRIIAADTRSANQGSFLEEIGWYDPGKKGCTYFLDLPRAEAWLKKGAQPSETVQAFIRESRKAAKRAPAAAPAAEAESAPAAE
jgi:small subunit ribosomal protein S16